MSVLLDITFNMPFDLHYLLTIYLLLLHTMLDALLCSAISTICLSLYTLSDLAMGSANCNHCMLGDH